MSNINQAIKKLFTKKFHAAAILLSIATFAPSSQANGFIASVGYGKKESITGLELQLGFRKEIDQIGIEVIPLSGIFYSDKNSRYREETFSNGTTVCRDTTNGQFSDKENCGSNFAYAAHISADYQIFQGFKIGAGVRVGGGINPYISTKLKISKDIGLYGNFGKKYSSAGLFLDF